jgi:hypothetical protein
MKILDLNDNRLDDEDLYKILIKCGSKVEKIDFGNN